MDGLADRFLDATCRAHLLGADGIQLSPALRDALLCYATSWSNRFTTSPLALFASCTPGASTSVTLGYAPRNGPLLRTRTTSGQNAATPSPSGLSTNLSTLVATSVGQRGTKENNLN